MRRHVRGLQGKGGQTAKERRQLAADLLAGDIDIVIGTHALITDSTQYKSLGLAIIDEQHKCVASSAFMR